MIAPGPTTRQVVHRPTPQPVPGHGAGPAGTAAALNVLRLRPAASVLLLDAAAFPRDKTCGDGVTAEVFDLLDGLGATEVRELGVSAPWLRLRTPHSVVVHRSVPRPNRVIPRREFDAALVETAVSAGAELRRHRVRAIEQFPDRVVVDGTITARVVVGTAGAHSVVRRALGAPNVPPASMAVAIRGYIPTCAEPGTLTFEYDASASPGYAWSFPLTGGGANVGYGVFDQRRVGSRTELLERLAALLPGQEPDPATVRPQHLPMSTALRFHPDGRVLLAGDAAAMVNPLTGEGIFDAVASGILAGRSALLGPGAGRAHRAAMRQTFGRHHRHVGALARLAAQSTMRMTFLDAAISAAAAHRTVFDNAVPMGQARGTLPPTVFSVGHRPSARQNDPTPPTTNEMTHARRTSQLHTDPDAVAGRGGLFQDRCFRPDTPG